MSRFSSDSTKCRSDSLLEPRVNLRQFFQRDVSPSPSRRICGTIFLGAFIRR